MKTKERQDKQFNEFVAKVNLASAIDTLETELKFVHLSNAPISEIEDKAAGLSNEIFKLKLKLANLSKK